MEISQSIIHLGGNKADSLPHLILCDHSSLTMCRLPFPIPGDLPDPGVKPASLALAGGFFTVVLPGKPSKGEQSIQRWVRN